MTIDAKELLQKADADVIGETLLSAYVFVDKLQDSLDDFKIYQCSVLLPLEGRNLKHTVLSVRTGAFSSKMAVEQVRQQMKERYHDKGFKIISVEVFGDVSSVVCTGVSTMDRKRAEQQFSL